jgi:parvulin-like peptidyl-prolyl isomerase
MKQLVFSLLFIFSKPLYAQDVLATVGAKKITVEEFNKRFIEVREKTQNPPPKDLFLEDLIRYEMGVQEAKKKGAENDPLIAERLRQELYKGFLEKELTAAISKINVTEDEMKSWYSNNPEIRSSHILVELKPDANSKDIAATKKRAQEVYDEVKKSKKPFEELVTLYTDDRMSKDAGGDIGWQTPLTIVPDYYRAVSKLKVGEIKGLIETKYGFHIVKLTGKNSYEQSNKKAIQTAVFDEKRKKIFDDYFKGLRAKYDVKINKSLLK